MHKEVDHYVLPGYKVGSALSYPGETVEDFLVRQEWSFKLPTICTLNGQPLMQADWSSTEITPDDHVIFMSKPHGGSKGSKLTQVLGIVGLIALSAIAPWAAGEIGTMVGITSKIGLGLIQAGLVLGGALLISTLTKPKVAQTSADSSDIGQVYSLSGAGNTASPLQCIPVQYGRLKFYPDYCSQPWNDYVGDDQYLNLLFCVGLGTHDIEQITIQDTELWNKTDGVSDSFQDVQIEIYEPGENVDLFPVNIAQTSEVSNLELGDPALPGDGWVGGYIVNNAGTVTNKISVDLGFPSGLFSVDGNGSFQNFSVSIQAEYRKVDDAGTPVTSYTSLFGKTYTFNTRTPKRVSEAVEVTAGRYQVRVRRTNAPSTDSNKVDGVVWISARAYLEGPTSFENVQTIAIRMKATAQLSSQASQQIGVIATRKLQVWDPTANGGAGAFVLKPTQNAFWAFFDAATSTLYGASRPVGKLDFAQILTQANNAEARGDTFNYRFTDFTTIPEAFDKILTACRSKHLWVGDVLSCVRDEWQAVPSMLLTDNQIVRGSLNVNYIFNDEDSSDSVMGQFLNEETWQPAQLQYPPNSVEFTAVKPSNVQMDGVTNPTQFYNEIAFLYRQAQLRRIQVTCDTEHDGRLLKLLSPVKVQSFLPRTWGKSGEVLVYNSDTNIVTTNQDDMVFEVGQQYYAEFRDKLGKHWGPVKIAPVSGQSKQFQIDPTDLATVEDSQGTIVSALARMDNSEPPSFVMGKAGNLSRQVIVLSGKPSGDKVTLNMVIDSAAVHDEDNGDTPTQPTPLPIQNPNIPIIANFFAAFRQGVAEPMLDGSWIPSPGALGYRARVSYDYTQQNPTWVQIYEGVQPSFSGIIVQRANLRVEVQAFNDKSGPWVGQNLTAPSITIAPGTVAPESMQPGLNDYVMNYLSDISVRVNFLSQSVANKSGDVDAAGYIDTRNTRNIIQAQVNGLTASIEETGNIATTIDGKLTAAWFLTLNVNNYVSGMTAYNTGATAGLTFVADIVQFAAPGVNGGLPQPFFQSGFSNGQVSAVIGGAFIGDGSIKAYNVDIVNLSSLTANVGLLTAGKIQSADGYTVFDLDAGQLVGYGS